MFKARKSIQMNEDEPNSNETFAVLLVSIVLSDHFFFEIDDEDLEFLFFKITNLIAFETKKPANLKEVQLQES